MQTRGGILAAWHSDVWSSSCTSSHCFSVAIKLKHIVAMDEWWLMTVYGLTRAEDKQSFLEDSIS
jgi:hypothetical protein